MSIERLQQQIRAKKNPTMVSLDPVAPRLPAHLLEEATGKHGETLSALAHAYEAFSFGILDVLRDLVPAVKVQAGCFQALGRDGAAALETVLAYARELGYYVLLDTAASPTPITGEALAQACFGGIPVGTQRFTPLACDGLSLQPYQGSNSLADAYDMALMANALCDYARANKDKAAVEAALSLISKLDADYRQNGLWSINSSRSPSAGFIRVKVLSDEERPSYVGEALQAIAKLKAITGMKKISDAEDSAKRIGGSFAQNYDGVGASIKLASFVGDKSI